MVKLNGICPDINAKFRLNRTFKVLRSPFDLKIALLRYLQPLFLGPLLINVKRSKGFPMVVRPVLNILFFIVI